LVDLLFTGVEIRSQVMDCIFEIIITGYSREVMHFIRCIVNTSHSLAGRVTRTTLAQEQ